ncbi:MAG TPA: KH domain-containing protein [Candidatus Hydrogenedens sp.]|nr:KH domain-containing protein [Candidatus Hydrogenedens sp.]HOK09693.1 KH domain-containing protein [Candidatus Hydrogenedens sp.]HOL19282.1 KH domain-containing protein [Candidatus Hydrogenedens sp.]HPP59235.1 KH domain-containing protein [Candidatus Hydrogenedens sp.]
MKELVEFIVKKLVKNPEEVTISSIESEDKIILQLKVNKEDMGRVIGRNGKTIKAIRTLLNIASIKLLKRVNLEVLE